MTALINESKLARLANAVHVQVALDEGAKAGYRQYMSSVGRNPEYDLLNAKRGFDRYCGEFGPYLEILGLAAAPAASVTTDDDMLQKLVEQAESLNAQIAALTAKPAPTRTGRVKAAVAKVTKSTPKAKKAAPKAKNSGIGRESRFSNGVIERKGLPTDVGDTFVWKGTNGVSTWEIVEDTGDEIFAVRIA